MKKNKAEKDFRVEIERLARKAIVTPTAKIIPVTDFSLASSNVPAPFEGRPLLATSM